MRCRYCFYADVADSRAIRSYGIMSLETAEKILNSVRADMSPGDRLSIAFQGGEPTLAGIDFFSGFFSLADRILKGIRVSYAFQTNGLLLNEAWCRLLKERHVLTGLSMDGPPDIHNSQRPDAASKGSYNRILASMNLLRRHGVMFNVLIVLTSSAARHPDSMWNWILKENIKYVQFIPCLDGLETNNDSCFSLSPSEFRDFYLRIFSLWERAVRNGQFISIKLYDDLVNLFLAGNTTACGISGKCTVQYIVEANGDVFPCDFYVLDQYKMGSIILNRPSELKSAGTFFLDEMRGYTRSSPCISCSYYSACGGGCKRMKNNMYFENGKCCYAELLDVILHPLLSLAEKIIHERSIFSVHR